MRIAKKAVKTLKTKTHKDSPAHRAVIAGMDASVTAVKVSAAYRPSK